MTEQNKPLSVLRGVASEHELNAAHQEKMDAAMQALEAQWQQQSSGSEGFTDALRRLEAEWESEHPLLAAVVRETLLRLTSIGV